MTPQASKRDWVLRKYVGKEVYIVAPITDADALLSGFYINTDKEALFSEILPKDIETEDYKCIHGILMPAEVLPFKDFLPTGMSCYLLAVDIGGKDPEGTVASYDDITSLEADLGDMLQENSDIDNLYVIYGYDMELRVSVSEKSITPAIIKEAVQIAKTLVPK